MKFLFSIESITYIIYNGIIQITTSMSEEKNSNSNTKILTDKDIQGKEYRKEYYQKNKETILRKKKESKQNQISAMMTVQETKFHEVVKKLAETKYTTNDGRAKLSMMKNDYRILKALFVDKEQVAYQGGTYYTWILLINNLIVRNDGKVTNENLMNLLKI